MKSIFRIYARTSKPNDKYLYNELYKFGLKPKYEELLHSFYFNATFEQIFKLSFQSFTTESFYVQLGHKYPLSTEMGQNQSSFAQFLKKINFRNYIPLQRNVVENITLKILMRQSSQSLPSQNVIGSIFQNHLQKQIILKQYRKLVNNEGVQTNNRLQNYYDIKQIVQKKWMYQDQKIQQQQQKLLTQQYNKQKINLIEGQKSLQSVNLNNKLQNIQNNNLSQLINSRQLSFQPNFLLYIRRNNARLLLKINKQSMHKFGWKKNIGWGPIRQTLTASILYRTGLLDYAKQKKQINIWDPFCGSMTIPLVALSMLKSLRIRKDVNNFTWQKWSVYKPSYLLEYQQKLIQQNKGIKVNVFGSDIDVSAVRNSVNNFKDFIQSNKKQFQLVKQNQSENFLKFKPSDQVYEIIPSNIYVGCGDFQQFAQKILTNSKQKTTIITNLPYIGQRSKQHHQLNQLQSIYKRFNKMVQKYKENIDNIFVIIDADIKNPNHFLRVSNNQWSILEYFTNGGIQVCLLGWNNNKAGWKEIVTYSQNKNQVGKVYVQNKAKNLEQYRSQIKQLQNKKYNLPSHLDRNKKLSKGKRVIDKIRVRHLRAAYQLFAKRRDKNQIFQKYSRKNLVLRLSQRGKTWKRKNMGLIGSEIESKQVIIKKQFQSRIEEALKRSQQIKQKKKQLKQKPKPKW